MSGPGRQGPRGRGAPAPTSAASVPRRLAACRAAPVPSGADPSHAQTDEVTQRLLTKDATNHDRRGMIPARVFGDKRRHDDHAFPRSATTPALFARTPFGV